MKKENCIEANVYTRPMVVCHQPVRFETAHSWNKGVGLKDHGSTGNDGIHYPLDPRPSKKF